MSEKCPYCNSNVEINHDDGAGYAEDQVHQQECGNCEKTFVFTTSIIFYYDLNKVDCLNGAPHEFKPTMTVPRSASRMRCSTCDEERPCTQEEMQAILDKDISEKPKMNCPERETR
jgi:hypothetical protein